MSPIDPLSPLADAIAERVWQRLQARFAEREQVNLLSVPAAAKRMGICKTKLHSMIGSGELPAKIVRRIGRRTLISAGELDRWLSAQ